YAHKFILCARSPVIKRMLSSSMVEASSSVLRIRFPATAVRAMLKYLYSGLIELTSCTVLDIMSVADYYSLEELLEYCGWYSLRVCMEGDKDMDICKVLFAAEQYGLAKIRTMCIEYITQHSMDTLLSSPNWHLLTEESVITILKQDNLRVPEVEIFDSLVRWARKQFAVLQEIADQATTPSDAVDAFEQDFLRRKLKRPLECVRFANMTTHQLSNHIEASGLVDKEIMFDVYRGLASKDAVGRDESSGTLRQGVQDFRFGSPGDEKGLFYYFGTCEDTTEYESPVARNIVTVSSSAMSIGYPHPFVSRLPTNMYTDKLENSHFTVDLTERFVICPTYYSMRYAGDSQGSIYAAPKRWQLQGSLDGCQWDVLRDHVDDLTLKEGFAVGAWPVDSTHSYRYLRIQMTGLNQRDGYELCVCCFEVYGRLVKLKDQEDQDSSQSEDDFDLDYEYNHNNDDDGDEGDGDVDGDGEEEEEEVEVDDEVEEEEEVDVDDNVDDDDNDMGDGQLDLDHSSEI
ncbi:hypothetical protein SAMD00019534_023990, partial [Acytostelium subglobosum LB1]|uniref:hypothetical protein n=1 Tax=Acytostelium subglobosum LB1 TaxID=1410327 RepID=UPI000644C617